MSPRPLSPAAAAPRALGLAAVLISALIAGLATPEPAAATWSFTNVAPSAGINHQHGYATGTLTNPRKIAGGVAAGDYDGDGWHDLYVVCGTLEPNRLYRNLGDGTFAEVGAAAGVNLTGTLGSGPVFADYDGDGDLDLFVGGIENTPCSLFRNNGDGTFTDVAAAAGVTIGRDTFSAAFGDYDRDGHLDLATAHWGVAHALQPNHLWRNNGDGTFSPVDTAAGVTDFGTTLPLDFSFAPNFVDINSDGWPDLLYANDFSTSRIFLNDGDGTFTKAGANLTDENAMGSAIGDYDNDGDLDWFVSCIWDPGTSGLRVNSGNRLYNNPGDGTFTDATAAAGVLHGWWGWGASFADFDNDGWLDLAHVNGWYHTTFQTDPARFWRNAGDGTFVEMASALGLADPRQGRGIACLDYDRDGDLDLFMANNGQAASLYRNDGGNALNWLGVRLIGNAPNTEAIGARIRIVTASGTQMRETRAGCNFVSQDPSESHFGLGAEALVDSLEVTWPDGAVTLLQSVAAGQLLTVDRTATTTGPTVSGSGGGNLLLLGAAPNPALSRSTVRFRLRENAPVSLRIHDAAGRRVRTVNGGAPGPGEHALIWNGRDDSGRAVPAGVYFYELRAGTARATGKVALVR